MKEEDFRKGLNQFTGNKYLNDHITLMEDLKGETSHSIELIAISPALKDPTQDYNCFMFILNLDKDQRVKYLQSDIENIFIGSEFILRLIEKKILEKDEQNGKIVIYFKDDEPVHAGKLIKDNRVISKWTFGHLWEHDIWDVPYIYGESQGKFSIKNGIGIEEIVSEFLEFYNEKVSDGEKIDKAVLDSRK